MPQTLFVSNLPSQITEAELETIFSRHGRVLRAWLDPGQPARSPKAAVSHGKARGPARKGYVEVHPEDADTIVWTLNGSWYKTSWIDVQTQAEHRRRSQSRERAVYTAYRY